LSRRFQKKGPARPARPQDRKTARPQDNYNDLSTINQIIQVIKTTTKQFTAYGNLAIIQASVKPETTFNFKPAAPEMITGGLVISEATGAGVVGTLIALNNMESYLLLTDADVLAGAKQNRVLNKSVLLAPMTKTLLDVSCVERMRWQYTTKNFTNPGSLADPDLRREKAASQASKRINPVGGQYDTQREVWSQVSRKMASMNFVSETESYSDLVRFAMESKGREFPSCDAEKGCNCIAVFMDSKVICADIFGTEAAYQYYFPLLRDSAFRMALTGKNQKSPDMHEAYYRVQEMIDSFMEAEKHHDESYTGAGSFKTVENNSLTGFNLSVKGELIHGAFFAK